MLREQFSYIPMLKRWQYLSWIILLLCLVNSIRKNGLPGKVQAMTAACDAWLYNNQAGIPTIVFGPGSLTFAHSKDEQISMDDILKAAEILIDFIQDESQNVLLKKEG